jgi:serine/threonine-protein kinase
VGTENTPEATQLAAALADRYVIQRTLGAGGMATVYLAHDVKHDRDVAIKVLRPELAAVIGAERFLTEIKTTANLQHPHILPLFDSGTVNGTVFYVMPVVVGESLRDRLTREKQLPINDAVAITREVASALDYAHRNGFIHRDIKPENILLHDRRALVADFGIALAATSADTRMTEAGMSLGTPQYMSPEQALGDRELDARSDVFALGCMAYELLVGETPFNGPTAQAIVAKIITDDPKPPSVLRRSVSPAIDHAILTALEKLPADRWATADEFSRALSGEAIGNRLAFSGRTSSPRIGIRSAVFGAVIVAAIAAGTGWLARGDGDAPPLLFGQSTAVTSNPGLEILPAISPDGKSVAYAMGTWNRSRIYVRPVSGGRAIALTSDSQSVQFVPSWSPDGSRVLFVSNGAAYSVPASGGVVRQEVPKSAAAPIVWAGWAPDGKRIAYAVGDSLMLHDANGQSRKLASMIEPNLCNWSRDGSRIACAVGNAAYAGGSTFFANQAPSRIVVCTVDDGSLVTVSDSTSLNHSPVWSADGQWMFFVSNRFGGRDVFGQRLTRSGKMKGAPVRLTTGLSAHSISLSPDGRHLAYAFLDATSNVWSLPIPSGRAVSLAGLRQETFGSQTVEGLAVSRDGQWLYFDSNLSGNADLYRVRLPQGEQEQLSFDSGDEFNGVPSPDGREVSFHAFRTGSRDVYVMPLDGGTVQSVTNSPLQEAAADWSPDGTALAYMELAAAGGIWVVRRNADGTWGTPIKRLDYGVGPSWSPDSKLLAIGSGFGGRLEILPADSGAPRVLIDNERPGMPATQSARFSDDGQTVFIKSIDAQGRASIWSVPVSGGAPQLRLLFDDPARTSNNTRWALSANRFYFTIDDWQSDVRVLDVVGR